MKIKTTPNFWDCACERKYIHHRTLPSCSRCGRNRIEQPDSRVKEVEAHLAEVLDEILERGGDALSDLQQMCGGQHPPVDLRFPIVLGLRPVHLVFHLQTNPPAEQLVQAALKVPRNGHLQAAFQTAVRHAAACHATLELISGRGAQETGDG